MTEQMKQMSAMDPVTAFWLSEPFWRAALLVFIIVIGLRGIVDAIWTAWQTENTTALLSDYSELRSRGTGWCMGTAPSSAQAGHRTTCRMTYVAADGALVAAILSHGLRISRSGGIVPGEYPRRS